MKTLSLPTFVMDRLSAKNVSPPVLLLVTMIEPMPLPPEWLNTMNTFEPLAGNPPVQLVEAFKLNVPLPAFWFQVTLPACAGWLSAQTSVTAPTNAKHLLTRRNCRSMG